MKRPLRIVLLLIVALMLVPFLPLYIERTMLRSWLMDRPVTVIEWGWKLTTLSHYWSDYHYFKAEQRPLLWLAVNLALAFFYALVIALGIDRLLAGHKRRAVRGGG
jgi:hypothetical protein